MAHKKEGFPQILEEIQNVVEKTEFELQQEQEKLFLINLFKDNGMNVIDIINFENIDTAILLFTKEGVNYETSLRFQNAKMTLLNAVNAVINDLHWFDLIKNFPGLYLDILQIKGEIYITE